MPATCHECGESTTAYTTRLRAGKFIDTCKVCEHPPSQDANISGAVRVVPPEGLTLDHVHDEFGKPVRVTSMRELRAAEKRYNFRHITSNMNEQNWDKPPQGEKRSLADIMFDEGKFLYPEIARPMLKEMEQNGELIMPITERRGR